MTRFQFRLRQLLERLEPFRDDLTFAAGFIAFMGFVILVLRLA